jgi:hypothetical protein
MPILYVAIRALMNWFVNAGKNQAIYLESNLDGILVRRLSDQKEQRLNKARRLMFMIFQVPCC